MDFLLIFDELVNFILLPDGAELLKDFGQLKENVAGVGHRNNHDLFLLPCKEGNSDRGCTLTVEYGAEQDSIELITHV